MASFKANVDSWVEQEFPNANHGEGTRLRLRGSGSSLQRFAYIFLPRPFPLGATILSATLHLHLRGSWSGGPRTITVKRVTEKWVESKVTWNNKPAVDATHSAGVAITGGVEHQQVDLDITALLQDVAGGSPYFGLRLEVSDDTAHAVFSSDTALAADRPSLDISWASAPPAPTGLTPAGGQVVGINKPTLSWDPLDDDKDGGNSQASSQIQVSTRADFGSVEYDSAKQANIDNQWDLAATAYAGIPAAATRYWRVRVWNDSDVVSPWSAVQSMVYQAPVVLTITNPAVSPNNFVDEVTPPISWTVAGGTQESARVVLYRVESDGSLTELWRFERTVTAATTVTIPVYTTGPNVHRSRLVSGQTYRIEITVWDDLDRASQPGSPAGVKATRDFTYQRAGGVTSPSSLAAVADGARVVLTWQRATQPDYFSIRVDGKELLPRIDPTDVFVAGTTYSLAWWRAASGVAHTYEVEAVVSSTGKLKHSSGNPTADATTAIVGKYLVDDLSDPGHPLAVQFADRAQSDLAIGESGETYNPVGARAPVRITDAIRGFEGSISGLLMSAADRDNMLALKGRRVELRFLQKSINIPVELGEVQVSPSSEHRGEFYQASAEIFQIDEFFSLAGGT